MSLDPQSSSSIRNTERWYQAATPNEPLDQGDLLAGCPIIQWKREPLVLTEGENGVGRLREAVEVVTVDAVVMTQTCDLAQGHVGNVILCPHFTLDIYKPLWEQVQQSRNQNLSEKSWKRHLNDIEGGYIWNLAMLNREAGEDYRADAEK